MTDLNLGDPPGTGGASQKEIRGPLKYIVRSAHKWGGNGRIPKFHKIKRVLETRHPEVIARGFGGDPDRAAGWLKDAWYKYWGISVKGKHGAGPTYWRGKGKTTRVAAATREKMKGELMKASVEAPEGFFDGIDAELWLESSVATKKDGLVWLEATRTGTWERNPVAGARGPLKIDFDLLAEIKRNFDEGAWEHVTVPLEHPRTEVDELLRNTGHVRAVKVVADPQRPGHHILLTGVEFTEPDAEGRVLRGTIPGRSVGVSLSGVTRHKDGKRFKNVLKHLALTAKPVIDGLKVGAADPGQYEELMASISYELSDEPEELDIETALEADSDDELLEEALVKMLEEEEIDVEDADEVPTAEIDGEDLPEDEEPLELSWYDPTPRDTLEDSDFAAVWTEDGKQYRKLPYKQHGKLNKRGVRAALLLFSKTRMPASVKAKAAAALAKAAAELELKSTLTASVDEFLAELETSYNDSPMLDRPRISGFGGGSSDLEFPSSVNHREAESLARSCANCEYYYEGDVCGRFGLDTQADDVCDDLQQVGVTVNFSQQPLIRVKKEVVLRLAVPGVWEPSKHPRWPKDAPLGKGGEFMETIDILDTLRKQISGLLNVTHLAKGSKVIDRVVLDSHPQVDLNKGAIGSTGVPGRGSIVRVKIDGKGKSLSRTYPRKDFTVEKLLADLKAFDNSGGTSLDAPKPFKPQQNGQELLQRITAAARVGETFTDWPQDDPDGQPFIEIDDKTWWLEAWDGRTATLTDEGGEQKWLTKDQISAIVMPKSDASRDPMRNAIPVGKRVTMRFEKRRLDDPEMRRGTVVEVRPGDQRDPRVGTVVEWDHAPGQQREYRMGEVRELREGEDVPKFDSDKPIRAKSSGKTLADFKPGDIVMLGGRDHTTPREQKRMAEGWALLNGPHQILGTAPSGVRVKHLESGHEYTRLPINSATLMPPGQIDSLKLPGRRNRKGEVGTGLTEWDIFEKPKYEKRKAEAKKLRPKGATEVVMTTRGPQRVRPPFDSSREVAAVSAWKTPGGEQIKAKHVSRFKYEVSIGREGGFHITARNKTEARDLFKEGMARGDWGNTWKERYLGKSVLPFDDAKEPEHPEIAAVRKAIKKRERELLKQYEVVDEDDKELKRLRNKLRRMTAPEKAPFTVYTKARKERDLEKGNQIIRNKLGRAGNRPPRQVRMPWTPPTMEDKIGSVYLHEEIVGTRSRFFARISLKNGTTYDVDIPAEDLYRGGDYVRSRMDELNARRQRVGEAAVSNLNPRYADVDSKTLAKWLRYWTRQGNNQDEVASLNKELAARKATGAVEGDFGLRRQLGKINAGRLEAARAALNPEWKDVDDRTLTKWMRYWARKKDQNAVKKHELELESRRIIRNMEGDGALAEALSGLGVPVDSSKYPSWTAESKVVEHLKTSPGGTAYEVLKAVGLDPYDPNNKSMLKDLADRGVLKTGIAFVGERRFRETTYSHNPYYEDPNTPPAIPDEYALREPEYSNDGLRKAARFHGITPDNPQVGDGSAPDYSYETLQDKLMSDGFPVPLSKASEAQLRQWAAALMESLQDEYDRGDADWGRGEERRKLLAAVLTELNKRFVPKA